MNGRKLFCFGAMCLLALTSAGCSSARKSDTARTGTEQMLVSNAVDQALAKIDFRPLSGHHVYIDEKYMDSVDKNYVLASVRHRLLRVGAEIADKPELAEMVVEIRSGAVGTDDNSLMVGIPSLHLGPMMSIPEIAFFKRETQTGTAKIGLVAYDAKSKHVLGTGAVTRAQAHDKNWFALGMGPYNSGTLKQEIEISSHADNEFPLDVNDAGQTYVHNGKIQQDVFLSPNSTGVPAPLRNPTEGIADESQTRTGQFTPVGHSKTKK